MDRRSRQGDPASSVRQRSRYRRDILPSLARGVGRDRRREGPDHIRNAHALPQRMGRGGKAHATWNADRTRAGRLSAIMARRRRWLAAKRFHRERQSSATLLDGLCGIWAVAIVNLGSRPFMERPHETGESSRRDLALSRGALGEAVSYSGCADAPGAPRSVGRPRSSSPESGTTGPSYADPWPRDRRKRSHSRFRSFRAPTQTCVTPTGRSSPRECASRGGFICST